MRTDGQTDTHDEANRGFSEFFLTRIKTATIQLRYSKGNSIQVLSQFQFSPSQFCYKNPLRFTFRRLNKKNSRCKAITKNVDSSKQRKGRRTKPWKKASWSVYPSVPTWLHHCQWKTAAGKATNYLCMQKVFIIHWQNAGQTFTSELFSPFPPTPNHPLMQTHIHISNWSNRAQTQYQATPTLFPI